MLPVCTRPGRGGGGWGGGGGTQQTFIRRGSAPRSKPLPFYVPFLIEKIPLWHTSHRKWYPFHIPSWGFKIFCPFQIAKWQFYLPFPILELVKSLPFHITPALKGYPFQAEPPRIVRYREYPPGNSHVLVCSSYVPVCHPCGVLVTIIILW